MTLIFGGYYQGKLDFAKTEFVINDSEIINVPEICGMAMEKNDQDMNYAVDSFLDQNASGAKCIYALDYYIRFMIERGLDSDAWVSGLIERCVSSDRSEEKKNYPIIIMNDISQGLVPLDSEDRAFREANGRALIKLAESADNVYRIFCGIPSRIK